MAKWFQQPITSGFMEEFYLDSGGTNKGLDFGMDEGMPIDVLVGGKVLSAGDAGDGWGLSVKVRDAQGRTHNYGHLSSINVKSGQTIGVGDVIGLSGNTGKSTGPHLSYDVWDEEGNFIDPTPIVNAPFYPGVKPPGASATTTPSNYIQKATVQTTGPSNAEGFARVGPPTKGGYQQWFNKNTGAAYWTGPDGARVNDPLDESAAGQGRTLFPEEAEQIQLQNQILRAQIEGTLIPIPGAEGRFMVPGTGAVVDTRQAGQFKPIEGMPGIVFDVVSGTTIDNNGNQIARENLDFEKARFAAEFPEQVRQHNETLKQNAELANQNRAEQARQFDISQGENTRQFDTTHGENKRQFDISSGQRGQELGENRRQFDTRLGEDQRQFDTTSIREILKNPSDFLSRAFFQRGGQSPLPQVTQADLINQLRGFGQQQMLGDGGKGPTMLENLEGGGNVGLAPGGAVDPETQKAINAGLVSRKADGTYVYNMPNATDPKNPAYTGGSDWKQKSREHNAKTLGAGAPFIGPDGTVQTAAGPQQVLGPQANPATGVPPSWDNGPDTGFGAFQPSPTMSGGGFVGGAPMTGTEWGQPDVTNGSPYEDKSLYAAEGGTFPATESKFVFGDGKEGKKVKGRTGSEEAVTLKGPVEALKQIFVIADPVTKDEPMPKGKKMAAGGFSLGLPPGQVNQQQLVQQAQQMSPPAVAAMFGRGQSAPLRFGFPTPTPQMLNSLTSAEADAYNTQLGVEFNTTLDDVGTAVQQQFGAKRRTPRARLGGF